VPSYCRFLRRFAQELRQAQVSSLSELPVQDEPVRRSLASSLLAHLGRAFADPRTEIAKDRRDLTVLGHHGWRAARLHSRVRQLEKRLSEALGEQAWHESGLGTPADIDALSQKITHLEQQAIDLRLQLEEQGQDLSAARAANRELMAQLNTATRHR